MKIKVEQSEPWLERVKEPWLEHVVVLCITFIGLMLFNFTPIVENIASPNLIKLFTFLCFLIGAESLYSLWHNEDFIIKLLVFLKVDRLCDIWQDQYLSVLRFLVGLSVRIPMH